MEWKTIEGYENYEVSTAGQVRNKSTGRILKQCENGVGYLKIHIKTKFFLVHRLVATAFIPNPNNLTDVNHINEDKHDNRVENLEWVSHGNNIRHGMRTEKQAKAAGKKVYCKELDQVFDSISEAARETGCDKSQIVRVCKGKSNICKGFHFEYLD